MKRYIITALGVVVLVAGGYVLQPGESEMTAEVTAGVDGLVEVAPEIKTLNRMTYFNVYKNATSGEVLTEEISKEVYDSYAQGVKLPTREGFIVSADGGVSIYDVTKPVLKDGEFYVEKSKSSSSPDIVVKNIKGSVILEPVAPIEPVP